MNGPPPTNPNPDPDDSGGFELDPLDRIPPPADFTGIHTGTREALESPGPTRQFPAPPHRPLPGVPFDPSSSTPGNLFDRLRQDKNLVGFLALATLLVLYCAFELGGLVESTNRQPVPFGPLPTEPPATVAPAAIGTTPDLQPSPGFSPPTPQTTPAAPDDAVETDTTDTGDTPKPKHKTPTAVVNLNTADLNTLETLPGVGPKTAQKILDYRKAHDGFDNVNELMSVGGIGEKKMAKLAKWVKVH